METIYLKEQLKLRTYYFFNPETIDKEQVVQEILLSPSAEISEFHFSDLERAIGMSHFYFTMVKKQHLEHINDCYRASYRSRFFNSLFPTKRATVILQDAKNKMKELQKESSLTLHEYRENTVIIDTFPSELVIKNPIIPVGESIVSVDFSGLPSNDGIYIQHYEITHFDVNELQRNKDKCTIDIQYHSFQDKTFDSLREINPGEYSSSNRNCRLFNNFESAKKSIEDLMSRIPVVHSDKDGELQEGELINNNPSLGEFKKLNKSSLADLSFLEPPDCLSED